MHTRSEPRDTSTTKSRFELTFVGVGSDASSTSTTFRLSSSRFSRRSWRIIFSVGTLPDLKYCVIDVGEGSEDRIGKGVAWVIDGAVSGCVNANGW